MTDTLTARHPYPAYKDSGIAWLGEIPAHWDVRRLKYVVSINAEVLQETTDPDYEIMYVDIGNVTELGLENSPKRMRFGDAPSRARRIVRSNDVIISTVRTYLKAIAYFESPPPNLIASTGFAVLRPLNVEPKFLAYLVRSSLFIEKVTAYSVGVSYPAINPTTLGDFPVWLPPLPEQHAIAAFLDRETGRIDAIIAKKQRLIELLQEKRTALISHAVTKGLDPDAPMKDSGVEWIGEIPVGWEVRRLKFVAEVQTGLTLGRNLQGRKTISRPYLRVANVQDGFLDLSTITTIDILPEEVNRYSLQSGDVLMTEGGDFDKLGRGYIWEGQIEGCLHQNHVFAVRPDPDRLDSRFLAAVTTSLHGKNYFTSVSQQTTNLATINRTKLGNFPFPVPDICEQKAIATFLDRETARVDALIAKIESAIEKLQEYRTALISAAVTGKIDVRNTKRQQIQEPSNQ